MILGPGLWGGQGVCWLVIRRGLGVGRGEGVSSEPGAAEGFSQGFCSKRQTEGRRCTPRGLTAHSQG